MLISSSIPKFSSGSSLKPYVRQHNDVAVVDTARIIDPLVSNCTQSSANEKIVPKTSKKVAFLFTASPSLLIIVDCYEENQPIAQALDAVSTARIGLRCYHESTLFHSYSEHFPQLLCCQSI